MLTDHNGNVMEKAAPRDKPVTLSLSGFRIPKLWLDWGQGHEQDSSDGPLGRSAGSTRPSSEVLLPSSSRASQFAIGVSTRSRGSSLIPQLRISLGMGASLRGRYPGEN